MESGYDGYLIEEASDDDDASSATSSEDDVQTFLKSVCGIDDDHSGSESDDFEKEMNKELDDHVKKIKNLHRECDLNPEQSTSSDTANTGSNEPPKQKYYSDDYFSSDSDDDDDGGGDKKKVKVKHPVLSNDELLYDPDMDDQDQKWMDDKRRLYLGQLSSESPQGEDQKKSNPLPNSDAVLNCPCCMSLLSLDCQRHEIYKAQYRAMFVMNCAIDYAQELVYRNKKRSKKGHRAENLANSSVSMEEVYHAVRCSVCDTEVGVYDDNEVYHFFNVLASY